MKITNLYGLPEPIYDWLKSDNYTKGDADISVTELIDSPRIRVLKKKNYADITVDATSLLASQFGRAVHTDIEKHCTTGISEKRFSLSVRDWKLSGGVDHYQNGIITDYKTSNVYEPLNSPYGIVLKWEHQLNVYAYLLRSHDYAVSELKIFVMFKDHNRMARSYAENIWKPWESAGYPDKPWAHVDIPLWEFAVQKAYVDLRMDLHQRAEWSLPLCEVEETWRGKRCSSYCTVNKWCEQFKSKKKNSFLSKLK